MDFYQIFDDKEITMQIPVHTKGVPRGVKNGGVLRYNLRRLRVKGLPGNLPDFVEANVTPLKIGNKLYVTALASDNFIIQHPENTVVCQVKTSRNITAELDEEEDEVAADEVESTQVDDAAAVKE
jgi:large subunit ribosomal protein L25